MSRSTSAATLVAVDLGAESGRVVAGALDGDRLALTEVHRFPNGPVSLPDGLHWDVLHLWSETMTGIRLAGSGAHGVVRSIGVDSWGVDVGLLDRRGGLLGNPYHYRDARTDGMVEEACRRVPRTEIFAATGVQFMPINTLYQLLSMVLEPSPQLEIAEAVLTIPGLLNLWLTGRAANELTIATTTQCFDPRVGDWARPLLERLGIPTRIFGEVVLPGTVLGPLRPGLLTERGLAGTVVVAPASHDTASAVAAVPADGAGFAWISSGTWSVMGVEVAAPVIDASTLRHNVTNEGGAAGTWCLSRNLPGLWLVQECRRTWARSGQSFSYEQLTQLAEGAARFGALIDPEDERFLKPGDMPERIQSFCRATGQAPPESRGAIVRCALESLALQYRRVLERLEAILGHPLGPIHIVGGGAQNRLLNQLTADATDRTIIAGPNEAAAAGNILVQAIALGIVRTLDEGRAIIRRSFPLGVFEPGDRTGWDGAYRRFVEVAGDRD